MQKILIVDDEHSIRFTLKKFLENEGFEVNAVEEAGSALELIKNKNFDVVISDILMPKITGVELLHRILKVRPRVKVIMITGEPNVATAAEALRLGACDYLFKPVNKQSVVKAVKNALKIKELEDENRKYQENLEEQIDARTKELKTAMIEMERLQKELMKNERLKGFEMISSGIAHDINNSLTPIMIYSEALLERFNGKDSSLIDYIKKIIGSAEEIEKSIKKIDEFHLKAGKDFTNNGNTDVVGLCRFVENYFSENEVLLKNELKLKVAPPAGQLLISVNEQMMKDLLVEIISNSIDACYKGGVIGFSSEKKSLNIEMKISDNGCGMDEDVLEHCYDPYFSTKGPKYNGLGLSKVYGIVCRSGGHINITSRPEGGTEVILSFASINQGETAK